MTFLEIAGRLENDIDTLQMADRLTVYVRAIAPSVTEPVNQISQKIRTTIGNLMRIVQEIRKE